MLEEKKETGIDPPPAVWRALGLAGVGVLVLAVLAIALISAGVFDPQPVGDLVATYPVSSERVRAGRQRIRWLAEPQGSVPLTLRVTGGLTQGERDSGYGLVAGSSSDFLGVAVSPLGYVTVWEKSAAGERALLPWQVWPHVRQGDAENELQIDVSAPQVTVRVNRELLWQGRWSPASEPLQSGLYVESFGQAATVTFSRLDYFAPRD